MLSLGFLFGFGKSPYDLSLKGILINLFTVYVVLAGRELLKDYIINSFEKRDKLKIIVITTLLFTLFGIPLNKIIYINNKYFLIQYLGEYVITSLCENIFSSYLIYLGGAKFPILYFSIIKSFEYLSPILPNLQWIVISSINILILMFNIGVVDYIYCFDKRDFKYKNQNITEWAMMCIISVFIIWFALGIFPIKPLAVVTGSMKPFINPGDIVIIKKFKNDTLKIGDIIQYQKDNIYVIHRITDIKKYNDEVKYVLKGDNNPSVDDIPVSEKMIKGKVIAVIPKIGYPMIMFKKVITDNIFL